MVCILFKSYRLTLLMAQAEARETELQAWGLCYRSNDEDAMF